MNFSEKNFTKQIEIIVLEDSVLWYLLASCIMHLKMVAKF